MHLITLVQTGSSLPNQLSDATRAQVTNAIQSQFVTLSTSRITPQQTRNSQVTPQQTGASSRSWLVTQSDKATYAAIFAKWDAQQTGFMTGNDYELICFNAGDNALRVFSQSGLSQPILQHIWLLADMNKKGRLTLDEFCIAMHLINSKLNGFDVPLVLPIDLIPPSARELSDLSQMMKSRVVSDIYSKQSRSIPAPTDIRPPMPVAERYEPLHSNQSKELTASITKLEAEISSFKKDNKNCQSLLESINRENAELATEIKALTANKLSRSNESRILHKPISTQNLTPLVAKKPPPPPLPISRKPTFITQSASQQELNDPFQPKPAIKQELAPPQLNQETVASKASAMLAQRMAALGVSSPVSSHVVQTTDDSIKTLPYSRSRDKSTLPPIVAKQRTTSTGLAQPSMLSSPMRSRNLSEGVKLSLATSSIDIPAAEIDKRDITSRIPVEPPSIKIVTIPVPPTPAAPPASPLVKSPQKPQQATNGARGDLMAAIRSRTQSTLVPIATKPLKSSTVYDSNNSLSAALRNLRGKFDESDSDASDDSIQRLPPINQSIPVFKTSPGSSMPLKPKISMATSISLTPIETREASVPFLRSLSPTRSSAQLKESTKSSPIASTTSLSSMRSYDKLSPIPIVPKSTAPPVEYTALFSFSASKQDELTFEKGDIISLSRTEGDWGWGSLNGSSGWFPINYTEMRVSTSTAVALYDFEATQHDEITIKAGDRVEVVTKSQESWWTVRLDGKQGLVPSTYLQELKETNPFAGDIQRNPFAADIQSQEQQQELLGSNAALLQNTSWDQCFSREQLASFTDKEKNRQRSIFELITTERNYLRDLQNIVEIFYAKLAPQLSDRDISVVFSNIDELIAVNTAFYSVLERIQLESNFVVEEFGSHVLPFMSSFTCYAEYCSNQSKATKYLVDLRKRDPRLNQLLADDRVRNLDLNTFLLSPMQRITRYTLMLKQILKFSDENPFESNDIQSSITIVEELLFKINQAAF